MRAVSIDSALNAEMAAEVSCTVESRRCAVTTISAICGPWLSCSLPACSPAFCAAAGAATAAISARPIAVIEKRLNRQRATRLCFSINQFLPSMPALVAGHLQY